MKQQNSVRSCLIAGISNAWPLKFALVTGLLLHCVVGLAEDIVWQKTLGADSATTGYMLGYHETDKTQGLAIDNQGNVIVMSTVKGVPHLAKYSAINGTIIWELILLSTTIPTGISLDKDDNIFLSITRYAGGPSDAVLYKLSSLNGNKIWEFNQTGTASTSYRGSAVKVDPVGNVILSVTRDNKVAPSGYNAGLIKVSGSDGTKSWEAFLDTVWSAGNLIELDSDGNAFLTTEYLLGNHTDWETLKFYSQNGQILWRKSFKGTLDLNEYPHAIRVDLRGDVVVTGSTNAPVNGSYDRTTDIQTIKYAGFDGSVVWSRTASSPGVRDDYASDLAIDVNGDVYIIGQYGGESPAMIWKVIKYAGDTGQTLWENSYLGSGQGGGRAIAGSLDQQQKLLVVGSYGVLGSTTSGLKAVKYAPNGQITWELNIPNTLYAQDVVTRNEATYFGGRISEANLSNRSGILLAKIANGSPRPSLNVTLKGSGTGSVQSLPQALNCSTNCASSFDADTLVTLQAMPDSGSSFLSWLGGGCVGSNACQITMSASQSVTAIFRSNSLPPLSMRGGIDLSGNGKHSVLLKDSSGYLSAGQLVGNQILFTLQTRIDGTVGAMASSDFNGNGISDLIYRLDFTDLGTAFLQIDSLSITNTQLRTVKLPWRIDAVGDFDGDGYADIVWRYTGNSGNIDDTGVSYVWFINARNFPNSPSLDKVRKRGGAPLSWKLLGAVDMNGDEAADMVYISPTNDIRVLMATPNRTCANLSGGKIPAGFTALRLADFTGNRTGDILTRNSKTGEVVLISLDAIGLELPAYNGAPDDQNASCTASSLALKQRLFALPTTDVTWAYYEAGDLNGDGITDIIWSRPDGSLVVWLMGRDGGIRQTLLNAGTPPTGYVPVMH